MLIEELFWDEFVTNKWMFILYTILAVLMFSIKLVGPSHYANKLISGLKTKWSEKLIIDSLIAIGMIYVIIRALHYASSRTYAFIGADLWKNMKDRMYVKLLDRFSDKYDEAKLGQIITQFDLIPRQFNHAFHDVCRTIVPYGLGFFVLIFFFLSIDFWIGYTYGIYYIIMLTMIYLFGKKTKELHIKKWESTEKLNNHIQDRLSNLLSITTTNSTSKEIGYFDRKLEKDRLYRIESDISNLNANIYIKIVIILLLVILAIRFYKLLLHDQNKEYTHALIVIIAAAGYMKGFISQCIYTINRFAYIEVFYKSILSNELKLHERNHIPNEIKMGLFLKNVTFQYHDVVVYKNLNANLKVKHVNGIIGPSGSGKSTIAKLLLRLIKPIKGNIFLDDTNINNIDLKLYRQRIAFMQQDTKLFDGSVIENMRYGSSGTLDKKDISNILQEYSFDTSFSKMGTGYLDAPVGPLGARLSTGQRQIVLLVRAILMNRPILLLDEPTASVDGKNKALMHEAFRLLKNTKMIILITHDRDTINMCDNIVDLAE